MKKPTAWDDDETWGSDILGVGSYDRHAGNIGKVLNQTKIGFIRDDNKKKVKRDDTKRKTRTTAKRRNDAVRLAKSRQ